MTTPNDRLRRLESALPKPAARHPYDLTRLTAAQLRRCDELDARTAIVGMDGLTDQEVEDGAAIAEILLAPEWPVPETTEARTPARWRTEWQRT